MNWQEIQFDGLVGPTHHYAGLALGNLASGRNRAEVSNPRAAALEGLTKMQRLLDWGVPQALLPPLPRPDLASLRRLGFGGTLQQMLDQVWHEAPDYLAACCSASAMWAANAATVAPSSDTADGRLHLIPANLLTNFHRSLEAPQTHRLLRQIFADTNHFAVHEPLPAHAGLADEGAANHMRLGTPGAPGLHVFVHGCADHRNSPTRRYPARQTLAACQAVARLARLPAAQVIHVQQNPAAIDAGAFHNDVVAASHHHHLFCHQHAFVDQPAVLEKIRHRHQQLTGQPLQLLQVDETQIPLDAAITSYLFNSQIVTTAEGKTAMLLPVEAEENPQVKNFVQDNVLGSGFVQQAHYINVRQSMRNGGGPACLRLRVLMNEEQRHALPEKILLTPKRIQKLRELVAQEYPEKMTLEQLHHSSTAEKSWRITEKIWHLCGLEWPDY